VLLCGSPLSCAGEFPAPFDFRQLKWTIRVVAKNRR
jgi:hypothetical protein